MGGLDEPSAALLLAEAVASVLTSTMAFADSGVGFDAGTAAGGAFLSLLPPTFFFVAHGSKSQSCLES